MKRQNFHSMYKWLGHFKVLFASLAALVPLTLKANVPTIQAKLGEDVANAVTLTQSWAWLLTPCLLLLSWMLIRLQKAIGDPDIWKLLHDAVTGYRNHIFSDANSEYQSHHRVTLFRHHGWALLRKRWPWTGWLTPVVRSGHTTQACRSSFRVPKKHGRPEGVAGDAWVREKTVHIERLPDMQAASRSKEDIDRYAEATFISAEAIEEDPPQARSFFAVRVEVKGAPWGVLVADSRKETIPAKRCRTGYKALATNLEMLLQRI